MVIEAINRLCKENDISIFKLEKACGIGNGTIARWGESSPSVANLKKVADYFNVSLDEFLKE